MTVEVYRQHKANNVVICGDFNARIGEKSDTIHCDSLPERHVLDKTTNSYGDKLLTFINDIKGCIINGRLTPDKNYYTSVANHKGLVVVDYIITRQCDYSAMRELRISSQTDVADLEQIQHMISNVA